MSPREQAANKPAQARQRRRLQAHERLDRDRCQAPRVAEALPQVLGDLALLARLVWEIAGRIRSHRSVC